MVALELANETRFARARLKRDVKAGTVTIAEALEAECARRMRAMDVLMAQHRWGVAKARRVLALVPCSQHVLVEQLTERQKRVLARAVAGLVKENAA